MKNKKLFSLVTCTCLLVALVAMVLLPACASAPTAPAAGTKPTTTPAPAAEAFKWKMQTFAPPAMSLYAKSFMKLVDMVKTYTNGRVIIEPQPPAALVPVIETFSALRDGLIDGAYHVGQYNIGISPGFTVEDTMPLSYYEVKDQMAFMWGDYEWTTPFEDVIRARYAKYNINYLTAVGSDISAMCTRKPIRTMADLKGLKIRATGLNAKFLTKLGATVVNAPLAETYTGLATGTFDGVVTGYGGHVGLKLYEQAKYYMQPALQGFVAHIAISMNSWNKLSPELKNTVTLIAQDWANWHNRVEWPSANYTEGVDLLKAKGAEFVNFTELDQAYDGAKAIWDEVAAADADSAKAVEMFKNFMKLKKFIK